MVLRKVSDCSKLLAKKKCTISFVESASAGRMSYEFSLAEESGDVLFGGMVCYNADFKQSALDIPKELIEKYTPESAEVTESLAKHFHKKTASDVCVALTGLTTPGGSETPEKPVGTIFVHIIMPHTEVARRFVFEGSPEAIVEQAIEETAAVITQEMKQTN